MTLDDGQSQLWIKNPSNRYLIHSPLLFALQKKADGSVTQHLRKDSPGKNLASPWRPVHAGPFSMFMCLY